MTPLLIPFVWPVTQDCQRKPLSPQLKYSTENAAQILNLSEILDAQYHTCLVYAKKCHSLKTHILRRSLTSYTHFQFDLLMFDVHFINALQLIDVQMHGLQIWRRRKAGLRSLFSVSLESINILML